MAGCSWRGERSDRDSTRRQMHPAPLIPLQRRLYARTSMITHRLCQQLQNLGGGSGLIFFVLVYVEQLLSVLKNNYLSTRASA